MSQQQEQRQEETLKVAIVGGGLAGLATALALQRRSSNFDVHVLESSCAEEFTNTHAGAAVQLTPNGLQALREAAGEDVLQQVLNYSCEVLKTVLILPSKDDNTLLYNNLQTMQESKPSQVNGFPTVMIRWGVLRQILAQALAPNTIVFQQQVTGYQQQQDDKICLELAHTATGTSQESFGLLIAANGKQSIFRPTPLENQARLNLKAVVAKRPNEALPECDSSAYSLFLENGTCCFCGPASPINEKWTYWAISIAQTNGETNNMITTKSELLQHLAPHAQTRVFCDLIQATDESRIFVQQSSIADLPTSLTSDGKVCLVGDAAHVMSASYGQCTSFCLEDAATLAYCLSNNNTTTIASALQHYSQLRRDRCVEMQQKSQQRYSNRNNSANDANALERWIHDWTLAKDNEVEMEDIHMAVVG